MDSYVGEIRVFAGNYAPEGWAFCDGRLLNVQDYQILFSLIGNTYGGNGVTTFGLPNLQGRIPIHWGQSPGLANYTLGSSVGVDSVTLSTAQLPSHSHALNVSSKQATTTNPGPTVLPGVTNVGFYTPDNVQKATSNLAAATIPPSGGNAAHDNSMPSIALNYIISLNGIYPSQS
jgi:microcystin-dependent protein